MDFSEAPTLLSCPGCRQKGSGSGPGWRIWRRGNDNLWERQQQRMRVCAVEESR